MKPWLHKFIFGFYEDSPPNSQDMAPGIPRPSTTLAHMMVAEMLSNLDPETEEKTDYRYDRADHKARRVSERPFLSMMTGQTTITKRKFKSFTRVHKAVSDYENYRGYDPYSVVTYEIGGSVFPFNTEEEIILRDGYEKHKELKLKKEAVSKEEQRQQSALDLIGKAFTTPVLPEVEMPLTIPDCSVLKEGFEPKKLSDCKDKYCTKDNVCESCQLR